MDVRQLSEVLVEFARTLTADFSLQKTLDHLVERVVVVLPVTGAGVLMMDEERERHHFVAATDDVIRRIEGLQLELAEGPCLQAYRTGRAVVVDDLAADERFPRFSPRAVEAGLGAVFAFPLRLDAEQIGALELYTTAPAALSEADRDAAQTLADVMAAYLFNARVRSDAVKSVLSLRAQTLHDPLTGLPNRVLLQDRLAQAVRAARRSKGMVGVLFCDVDELKSVNDTHGHRAGDDLLKQVARRIEGVLRPGDTVARLSGDEFVIVCSALQAEHQAEEVAGRVLDCLTDPMEIGGAALVASVSIGISFARPGLVTAEDAVQQADSAMSAAKGRGGGRWVTAAAEQPRHLGDDSPAVELAVASGDTLAVELGRNPAAAPGSRARYAP